MDKTTSTTENQTPWVWLASGLTVAVLLIVALVSGIFNVIPHANGAPSSPSAESTSSPTGNPTPLVVPVSSDTSTCKPEFTQAKLDREGNPKVFPEFAKKLDEFVKSGNSDAYRKFTLKISGQYGQLLGIYAHQMGLFEDPTKWKTLVDGSCLSKDGQDLYHDLDVAYHVTGMTFSKGEAPANANNSGIGSSGQYGMDANSGISGDRTAIEITLPDGSKTWIMFRCGNPVFLSKPKGLPTVPTDNPAPPTVETPPTTNTPPTTTTQTPKDWNLNYPKPSGVTPIQGATIEPRPAAVATPAPVIKKDATPTQSSQTAPGATAPNPTRDKPAPATGTTPGGGSGSVNPTPTTDDPTPVNTGDPGNPFGG